MQTGIRVISSGIVYRNPKPYLRSVVAYHPSLVVFSENDLLATFDLGQGTESLDYHTVVARSQDSGETWVMEGPLLRNPPPQTTHTVRVSKLADGALVGFGAIFRRDDPEEGLINRQTSGFVPTDLVMVRSQEGGHTWGNPQAITPPVSGPCWEICHSILELHDGRWLAPVGAWRDWAGKIPLGEQTVALLSDDQGKTWPTFGRIFDGGESGRSHLEVSVEQLRDGRLLAVSWVHDLSQGKNFPTEYSLSESRGDSFSEPALTGFHAQTCKLIELRSGLLFCAFRDNERPGLWARVAQLEGNKWTNLGETVLWQGAETGMRGRASSGDELAELKFGYPNLKQLPNGDILLLFWCQEQCITNIRWIRVRVE